MSTDEKPSDYYDRYSRQHYVLGDKAMNKMGKASVLISGMGGLGVEIAKNVTLAGVRKVTLHDTKKVSFLDLNTQYYLSESQIGECRATITHAKISELNPYVKVDLDTREWNASDLAWLADFTCIVLTDAPLSLALAVNEFCHARNIAFLYGDVRGAFGWAFSDGGEEHEIFDPTGEPLKDALVEKVERGEVTKIKCFDNNLHDLQVGDYVQFVEMGGISEINYSEENQFIHKVTDVTSPTAFTIGTDSAKMSDHTHGGKVIRVNVTQKVKYLPLKEALAKPEFVWTDFAKWDNPASTHVAFQALEKYRETHGDLPEPWNKTQADEVVKYAQEINEAWERKTELQEKLVRQLAYTSRGSIIGLTAFLGGVTAQEVIKSLSGKYSPLNQWLYIDATELLPALDADVSSYVPKGDRYDAQRILIGDATVNLLLDQKLFMIGAGAIGCEMMKNFAMLGTGAGPNGKITLTDNDLIEKSNLNRQFLFRDADLQKPKSATAGRAAKTMNPNLMVETFLDKVCAESENKYSDAFFQTLDIVVNALDNVAARVYVDSRCTTNQKPLLESGTLGTKGHVQVILPHLTETYSNQSDPKDESFPVCTIKSFPAAIEHTIQWARSKFQAMFADKAAEIAKFFEDKNAYLDSLSGSSGPKLTGLRHLVKTLNNRPSTFEDCLTYGRVKFESYFNHIIKNLLHAFPLDLVMKDGTPFWKSPKRPPMALDFDPEDPNHFSFVLNTALLQAAVYKVDTQGVEKDTVAVKKILSTVSVPAFKPKNKKIETDPNAKPEEAPTTDEGEMEAWTAKLKAIADTVVPFEVFPQDFEKDDDSNHHVDFITACSNLRGMNYKIPIADRLETKRIAGKIIPAIATTTAAIAGLVSIELVKVVQKRAIDQFKNCFLNLALPSFQLTEPGAVAKSFITKETFFTIWDKWSVNKGDITVEEFRQHFVDTYKLQVTGIFQDVTMIWLQIMPQHKPRLKKKLGTLIKGLDESQNYVDLIVSFANEEGKDVNGPLVRYYFK